MSLGGSFYSPNPEDYYATPWDLGYDRIIKFDHEFVGRPALEAMVDQPHRRKVTLLWHPDDVPEHPGPAAGRWTDRDAHRYAGVRDLANALRQRAG